jgi:hypothetical protein
MTKEKMALIGGAALLLVAVVVLFPVQRCNIRQVHMKTGEASTTGTVLAVRPFRSSRPVRVSPLPDAPREPMTVLAMICD